MRILVLLAVFGCQISDGETTPRSTIAAPTPTPASSPVVVGDGWCPAPPPPRKPVVGKFEVSTDLRTVRPLRAGGFRSHEVSFDRDGRYHAARVSIGLDPRVANGKLQLRTFATSCHETNAGCFAGYWSVPARVELVDPTPVHSCIRYAFSFDNQIVIGFSDELRTYAWHDGAATRGGRRAVPPLHLLEVHDGRPLLGGADGTLWTVAPATGAPSLTLVATLPKAARVATIDNHGQLLAYTDDGLHVLDAKTFVEKWHLDGEITSVTSQDIPLVHYVLSIDRGAKPGVDLRTVDESGKELRRVRVKAGAVDEAFLESSYERVGPELVRRVLLVFTS